MSNETIEVANKYFRIVEIVFVAVSARQCVADASGLDRWVEVGGIPVSPLADSPANNILFCRGCCKPVTLTLNDAQKNGRNNLYALFVVLPTSLWCRELTSRIFF
jgi:hypothetical protein